MKFYLGPVLSFRGMLDNAWHVSCIFVSDGDIGNLIYKGESHPLTSCIASQILIHSEKKVWRFDLVIPQGNEAQDINLSLSEYPQFSKSFVVPKIGRMPKIAYASCNGFAVLKDMKKVEDKNYLWKNMRQQHAMEPYHILAMGGDQVYADSLWDTVVPIKRWAEMPKHKRLKSQFSNEMKSKLEDFYFQLYCDRWMQSEVIEMMSTIPTLMMWDDHDIFDGWGSYPEEEHNSPVFKGIFEIAKKYFKCFQQQLAPTESHPCAIFPSQSFMTGYVMGKAAILALDMRSERNNQQVISPESWKAIYKWLEELPKGIKHFYLMSSIPVVHPDFGLIEGMLGIYPGQQELEDDLRDHWQSRGHRAERLRLIHRLLLLAEGHRVTILSGDVHVAALGIIQSERNKDARPRGQVINQFTSSGIVHPAPPGVVLLALKILGSSKEDVDQGITAELINFPGSKHSFIGSRNWLSLEPDKTDDRVWANWFVETEVKSSQPPFTKVVHPIGYESTEPKLT